MINKIICWLVGHILREKAYVGMAEGSERNDIFGRQTKLYDYKYWDKCPRCGAKLT